MSNGMKLFSISCIFSWVGLSYFRNFMIFITFGNLQASFHLLRFYELFFLLLRFQRPFCSNSLCEFKDSLLIWGALGNSRICGWFKGNPTDYLDGDLPSFLRYSMSLSNFYRSEQQGGNRKPRPGISIWLSAWSELKRPAWDHSGFCFSTTATVKKHGRACLLISC